MRKKKKKFMNYTEKKEQQIDLWEWIMNNQLNNSSNRLMITNQNEKKKNKSINDINKKESISYLTKMIQNYLWFELKHEQKRIQLQV